MPFYIIRVHVFKLFASYASLVVIISHADAKKKFTIDAKGKNYPTQSRFQNAFSVEIQCEHIE